MLQGRLTPVTLAAAAVLVLSACSGDALEDFKPIENLERTGVTALQQAGALACSEEASMIRSALEIYEVLEGEPAPNEAALIGNGLREESALWDVRNGVLIAADPGCGEVPADLPAQEIVTEEEPATATETETDDLAAEIATMTPEDIVAGASEEEIADVGGPDCALEVAEVGLAFGRFTLDSSAEPTSLSQLFDEGYLGSLDLWTLDGYSLVPVPGSSCVGPLPMIEQGPDPCAVDRRTLEVAIEAYTMQFGTPPDNEQQLVDTEMLRTTFESYDVVYGEIVPGDDSACS